MKKNKTKCFIGILTLAGLLLLCLACIYLYFHSPFEGKTPLCLFYRLFHLYCPGCGLTRAFYLLFHGHPLLALRQNMVALPLLLFVLYLLLAEILCYLFSRPILPRVELPLPLILTLLSVFVLFAILRNIPALSFLAPMQYNPISP